MNKTMTVFVRLLGEGTPVFRPVLAHHITGSVYQLEKPEDYDDGDEQWEFSPESSVTCESRMLQGQPALIAVAAAHA